MKILVRHGFLAFLLFLMIHVAHAGEISISIVTSSGTPVSDAVVLLRPANGSNSEGVHKQHPVSVQVDQLNETFIPYVQVVPQDSTIMFHNSDKVRHHVYSFSPIKPFEYVLVPGDASPQIQLSGTGIMTIGCNIHDQMISFVFVTDAPYSQVTKSDGKATFTNLSPGSYILQTWHPRQKGRKTPRDASVEITDGAPANKVITLNVLPPKTDDEDSEKGLY